MISFDSKSVKSRSDCSNGVHSLSTNQQLPAVRGRRERPGRLAVLHGDGSHDTPPPSDLKGSFLLWMMTRGGEVTWSPHIVVCGSLGRDAGLFQGQPPGGPWPWPPCHMATASCKGVRKRSLARQPGVHGDKTVCEQGGVRAIVGEHGDLLQPQSQLKCGGTLSLKVCKGGVRLRLQWGRQE